MNKKTALSIVALPLLWLFNTNNSYSQNPLNFGSKIFTADPSAHVWKDGKCMYMLRMMKNAKLIFL